MVTFNRRRLQVFVSSTFDDLIEERQAAVEAILTAGHIPAGMELFAAGDESQMDAIKQWIDESDVFLLILGGRYGSIEQITGKSYIQLEYEYALQLGKPLFSCVIKEDSLEERVREVGTEVIEMKEPQKLRTFRDTVLTRLVKFWRDRKDIKIAVGETLSSFSRRDDLIGWVRADEGPNTPALADEIARLSKENALLRAELQHMKGLGEPRELRENRHILDALEQTLFNIEVRQEEQIRVEQMSLLEFFKFVGPSYSGPNNNDIYFRKAAAARFEVSWQMVAVPIDGIVRELLTLGLFASSPNPQYRQMTDKGRELLRGLALRPQEVAAAEG